MQIQQSLFMITDMYFIQQENNQLYFRFIVVMTMNMKEKEEKILRDNGVTEDTIEAIRLYDRQAFNSDRRYYERVQETGTYLDTVAASTDQQS